MVWMDNESKALMMSGPQCLYKCMLPSSGFSDYKVQQGERQTLREECLIYIYISQMNTLN